MLLTYMYSMSIIIHVFVYTVCSCRYLRLFIFVLVRLTVDTYWPAFTYPCGGEEDGMAPYCCVDRRRFFSVWGSAGSDVISYGSRSIWRWGVESQPLPCQGAMLCPDIYLPPCCCFGTSSLELERLLLLVIISHDLGKVAEATLHG